jgi:hypothetical protein
LQPLRETLFNINFHFFSFSVKQDAYTHPYIVAGFLHLQGVLSPRCGDFDLLRRSRDVKRSFYEKTEFFGNAVFTGSIDNLGETPFKNQRRALY